MHRFGLTILRGLVLFVREQSLHQHHVDLLRDRCHRGRLESLVESQPLRWVELQGACNSCAMHQSLRVERLERQVDREHFSYDEAWLSSDHNLREFLPNQG